MLGLNKKDAGLLLVVIGLTVFAPFILNPFPEGSALAQFNARGTKLTQDMYIERILVIFLLWKV